MQGQQKRGYGVYLAGFGGIVGHEEDALAQCPQTVEHLSDPRDDRVSSPNVGQE